MRLQGILVMATVVLFCGGLAVFTLYDHYKLKVKLIQLESRCPAEIKN